MLLVTLVIRSCLADGGPQGVLSLLSPEWSLLRDGAVVIVSHVVWVLLSLLLTLALLGAGDSNIRDSAQVIRTVTGEGLWLAVTTIVDKTLLTLGYGWLWAGLYLILLSIITMTR